MKKFRIAFVEEEFCISGGMRRMTILANGLVKKGHDVTMLFTLSGDDRENKPMDEVLFKVADWGEREEYDIAIMNHAPVWQAMRDIYARLKVYYWLGFEAAYFCYPSWQDAYKQSFYVIANSEWTADMAEMIYHKRPPVDYGGIDPKMFHPVSVKKEYELLCACPPDKPEKGYFEIKRAADILALPLENFADKNLPQDKLAEEYSKGKIFVAAPLVEGFFFPALEAMACGVPVVMTECGGNESYAVNNWNCKVVPRNAGELAKAIFELREDQTLEDRFIKNGIATAKNYNWQKSVDIFEKQILEAYKESSF